MAQYQFDPLSNIYTLEEAQDLSLLDVDAHGEADAGVIGNNLGNSITGDARNNRLDGGAGADTLVGGAGNDTYVVDDAGDVVTEALDEGTERVEASVDYTLGEHLEHLRLVGNGLANELIGSLGNDTLEGRDGNDTLDGGAGADRLEGGAGDDTYVVEDPDDVVIEGEGGGRDSVTAYVSYILPDHVEVLVLQGYDDISGTGNGLANTLLGSDGGNNRLEGLGGNDRLFGFDGDDTLDGGEGADELWGWSGNDTFIVDDLGDVVSEDENRGEDLVIASIGYTLSNHVEHLRLVGSQGLAGIGNGLDNRIAGHGGSDTLEGRDGNDTLDGGAGADRLEGGAGDDLYRVDSTDDVVEEEDDGGIDSVETSVSHSLAAFVENLVASGNAAIALTGNGLANIIQGNAAANTLDGGTGADTLEGGDGDDVYLVDAAGDLVTEAAGEGTDWVETSVDYALGDNLENLRLVGSQSLADRGNGLANQLIGALGNDTLEGGAGHDTLDGGAGADRLEGGVGDDLYRVDDAGDAVVELEDEGIDSVETSISYALAAFVENLVAIGNAAIDLTGNALANTLTGNAAENVLDGGAGADTLIGGDGDDTYIVDDADRIVEEAGGGIDTVLSATSTILGDHLERLVATGTAAVTLTGNGLDNTLVGNAAANTLDGGAGADHLQGGAGDDFYIVDGADSITEHAEEGTDTVLARASFVLGAHLENLVAAGTASIDLTGNALSNRLTGNGAANVLDGRASADTMSGGGGDDTYVVDGADTIIEQAGEGIDTVVTAESYTLGAHLENLKATGAAAISLTGNAGDNLIQANAAADTLDGGAGADTLSGGGGDDTYNVDGADTIVELAGGGTDTVRSAFSHALGNALENLTAVGSAAISLTGNALDNRLIGNVAANVIDGGAGADIMDGGAGDDILVVDNAGDGVSGGSGTDTVQTSVGFTLGADVENLTAAAGVAVLSLKGNAFGNSITGNGGANRIAGGLGNDQLRGGTGKAVFVFDTKPHKSTNSDKIYDFKFRDDSIWLDNKVFTKLGSGTEARPKKFTSDMFVNGTRAQDREDRIVYDKKSGNLYYDKDGTGGSAQVKIATIVNKTTLKFDDFFVI